MNKETTNNSENKNPKTTNEPVKSVITDSKSKEMTEEDLGKVSGGISVSLNSSSGGGGSALPDGRLSSGDYGDNT